MAKLPTLADHHESIDLASPGDLGGEYATDHSRSAAESAGDEGAGSGPMDDVATDESTLESIDSISTSPAAKPKPPVHKLSHAATSALADEPEAEFPTDPLDEGIASEGKPPVDHEAEPFTPELLAQAQQYGFTEESAKRFGTPENLQWAMAERDRMAAEWGQQQLAAMLQQQTPQQQPLQQAQQSPATNQQPQTPQGLIEKFAFDKSKLAAQGFDDDTISFLEGMAGHFNGQLERLGGVIAPMAEVAVAHQQNLQQITSQSQAEAQAHFARDIDAFFGGLGSEWEEVFGKGSINEQPMNSPAWQARRQIASTVIALEAADGQLNQQTTIAQRAERALNALHFDKKQELARKALSAKAQQRRSQSLARAGSQRGVPMTGMEKANRRSAAFDRKFQLEPAIG